MKVINLVKLKQKSCQLRQKEVDIAYREQKEREKEINDQRNRERYKFEKRQIDRELFKIEGQSKG